MDFILREKIKLGISACSFGAKVRWNHAGRDRVEGLGREKNDFAWVPVCPEVLSGFAVPRPRMKLAPGNGDEFWKGESRMKNSFGRDVSNQIRQGAETALDVISRSGVEGFVFMEGSPSCGVYRTTLKGRSQGKPPGVFGSLLLREDLFLIPALDIESPWKWWDWSRRLYSFTWLKRKDIKTKNELHEIWHALKFMCQEVDDKAARDLGRAVAGAPKNPGQEYYTEIKKIALGLLRKPSSLKKISGAMVKHYAHYRKMFGLKATELSVPDSEKGKTLFVFKLREMEKRCFENNYSFAGYPVIYKPER